jgi:glucose-1-phosphate adenylyltransferase
VGTSCRLRKVVVDRGCEIPDGTVIGEDPVRDGERFYRTESGVVLVTREALERARS